MDSIGEYVIPGNIIFRQRGTAWYPGENCKMGRDHCIFAMESGYVRYYRDPLKHPKRQYIGIVFEKDQTLPYPQNAARKRRLNMLPVERTQEDIALDNQAVVADLQAGDEAGSKTNIHDTPRDNTSRNIVMGRGYAYREANWEIGRAAEKANIQVKKFVPGDRFTAWQRSKARIATNSEKRRLRSAQKASKPKAKRR
jgi:ribosomal protein L27